MPAQLFFLTIPVFGHVFTGVGLAFEIPMYLNQRAVPTDCAPRPRDWARAFRLTSASDSGRIFAQERVAPKRASGQLFTVHFRLLTCQHAEVEDLVE